MSTSTHLGSAWLGDERESSGIMISDQESRAVHALCLVHKQVATLRIHIIGNHKSLW